MKTLNLQQGTDEWRAARAKYFTASEAPAMMGASKYTTRTQLLDRKAAGVEEEVTPEKQAIFDKGHAAEDAARPIAERIIGEELFPVTGVIDGRTVVDGNLIDLPLLASFDGITMLEDVIWEHKLFNADLARSIRAGELDDHYRWQLDQQLLVSGAERALFMCSDGTEENCVWMWYEPDEARFRQLIAGWKQFADDLKTHTPAAPETTPEPDAIEQLPALSIQITGGVTSSNLAVYKKHAMAYIEAINTDLQTDEDFANAEQNVKFCKKVEAELATVKKQALAQTADIDELFRTIDHLSESLRSKRLTLEKLVKARKQQIKQEIVMDAKRALQEHIKTVEVTLQGWRIPQVDADFAGAIKNKRTLSSLRDAADTELARAKQTATKVAMRMAENRAIYNELASDHEFLFADIELIAREKAPDDFRRLVESRISEHAEAERKRLEAERERIRKEEERKAREAAEREAAEKAEAERKRLEAEEKALRDAGKCDGNHGGGQYKEPERLARDDLVSRLRAAADNPALEIGDAWNLLAEAADRIEELEQIISTRDAA